MHASPISCSLVPNSVYLIDGFDTPASTVALLKSKGVQPVCYFRQARWRA
jgi:hypothetical protein